MSTKTICQRSTLEKSFTKVLIIDSILVDSLPTTKVAYESRSYTPIFINIGINLIQDNKSLWKYTYVIV